ncbi:ABC transporter permease subunit [Flaviflexus salsibiostraticola]|uniref:ABC transporter permease subunit n=1 Tax=Flaviflexus salsibiostraticola TaxID=1282737 RepID=A0A3S8ZA82_9ACTO|nr:ABC transporter permease subunit [Flaviflexus salsibiostraticola]AZN30376.1 ABC transporter permease subunit [Flaviflexus salsibiostraticola]
MSNELLFEIPLGSWARSAVDWLTANLKGLFDWLSDDLLLPMYRFLANLLTTPDFLSIGVILVIILALWKGWQAGAATAGAVALGYLLNEFVTGGGLALPWWVVAIVFAAIAVGAYFWTNLRVALAVIFTLALAFAIDQWFLVNGVAEDGAMIHGVDNLPEWTIGALLVLVAFATKGWRLALGSLIGFAVIYGVDQWTNAMSTFALVLVASIIAIILGIPIGILAAKNRAVSTAVRPILDFLQTMPAFVYLIPFVVLFGIGVVPGIVATILFSIAPAVRFTELGIKQVDKEVVEAAHAFGAHPGRILGQIELPLARATIMGGVNQVIMLALSMVVIAGMVGAGGLGQDVYTSVTQVNISLGAESGIAVVILAMYLDRVTAAFGTSKHEQLAN